MQAPPKQGEPRLHGAEHSVWRIVQESVRLTSWYASEKFYATGDRLSGVNMKLARSDRLRDIPTEC